MLLLEFQPQKRGFVSGCKLIFLGSDIFELMDRCTFFQLQFLQENVQLFLVEVHDHFI